LRRIIEKFGILKSCIAIMVIVVGASLLGTYMMRQILLLFAIELNLKQTMLMGGLVPAITAPLVIVPIVRLLYKINTLENSMRLLATYDGLTGLLNRRAFLEQAIVLLNQRTSIAEKYLAAILAVDLDHFKMINDRYGHSCGDEVLQSFGEIAQKVKRMGDLAGRMGGEEFAFFLPNVSQVDVEHITKRLHESIPKGHDVRDDCVISYTVSIGVTFIKDASDFSEALKRADKALYYAKENGRNQTAFC
jgi:diguanylate cyclase (GGDEF)-like protein